MTSRETGANAAVRAGCDALCGEVVGVKKRGELCHVQVETWRWRLGGIRMRRMGGLTIKKIEEESADAAHNSGVAKIYFVVFTILSAVGPLHPREMSGIIWWGAICW